MRKKKAVDERPAAVRLVASDFGLLCRHPTCGVLRERLFARVRAGGHGRGCERIAVAADAVGGDIVADRPAGDEERH
eukprot:5732511-Pleurochrysis_carterae.AAC.1